MLLLNTCQVGEEKMLKRNGLMVLHEGVRPYLIMGVAACENYLILNSNCLDRKKAVSIGPLFFLFNPWLR